MSRAGKLLAAATIVGGVLYARQAQGKSNPLADGLLDGGFLDDDFLDFFKLGSFDSDTVFTFPTVSNTAGNREAELETVNEFPIVDQTQSVDWDKIRYFTPAEFGGNENLKHIDPRIIHALDDMRHRLGKPIRISPAPGALFRLTGSKNSRHYAVGRLSDAIDIFPESSLREAYNAAVEVSAIGGIGVYPDWKPRPGMHIDGRPRKGGRVANWMGRNQPGGGQFYAAIDWGFIDQVAGRA